MNTLGLYHLMHISIHALREEGDYSTHSKEHPEAEFLSTPSARRATTPSSVPKVADWISIHALREEGDFVFHGADVV